MVNLFSTQGGNEKPLPNLPPSNTINTNSSRKNVLLIPYYNFSRYLETKHPRVAKYKKSILITIGLLILITIIVTIIVTTVSGHKKGDNTDEGGGSIDLSGEGDGTYYDPGVGTGSCGWMNYDSELVAALNAPQYGTYANPNNSPVCGKFVKVTGPKGSVKCPVCKNGDLDMSSTAFSQIAEIEQGRVKVTWKMIS
ncbi:11229_t:CDS:2 [Diversispora eburnea]|uniref:11229_t:CDS:1 n=1 Tax=Diversispora eburnea TaxID=1213867 RepID=A0A9N9F2L3_9GLOM|nr:11229_t:CDS:2 [Diversispora eburnea]